MIASRTFIALCSKCQLEIDQESKGSWVHKYNRLGLCYQAWPCYREEVTQFDQVVVTLVGQRGVEMPKGKKAKKKKK